MINEAVVVEQTTGMPATVESLRRDFAALGVQRDATVLVHASLSSIGWVCGGAAAVVLALEEAIGPDGTLATPAFSGGNSEPAHWCDPPVPEAWWEVIRDATPAFDPDLTPTRAMGAVAETFRKQRGTMRSDHPQVSFAARGPNARYITRGHPLDFPLGDDSPLGKLYELDAWVLLLGVGHERNSSLHLAEARAHYPRKLIVQCGAAIQRNGERVWCVFHDVGRDDDDFAAIGASFAAEAEVAPSYVGRATACFFSQRRLVDSAVGWMEKNRL